MLKDQFAKSVLKLNQFVLFPDKIKPIRIKQNNKARAKRLVARATPDGQKKRGKQNGPNTK